MSTGLFVLGAFVLGGIGLVVLARRASGVWKVYLPGDVDGNGSVDATDIMHAERIIINRPRPDGTPYPLDWIHRADANNDGQVNVGDVTAIEALITIPPVLPSPAPDPIVLPEPTPIPGPTPGGGYPPGPTPQPIPGTLPTLKLVLGQRINKYYDFSLGILGIEGVPFVKVDKQTVHYPGGVIEWGDAQDYISPYDVTYQYGVLDHPLLSDTARPLLIDWQNISMAPMFDRMWLMFNVMFVRSNGEALGQPLWFGLSNYTRSNFPAIGQALRSAVNQSNIITPPSYNLQSGETLDAVMTFTIGAGWFGETGAQAIWGSAFIIKNLFRKG